MYISNQPSFVDTSVHSDTTPIQATPPAQYKFMYDQLNNFNTVTSADMLKIYQDTLDSGKTSLTDAQIDQLGGDYLEMKLVMEELDGEPSPDTALSQKIHTDMYNFWNGPFNDAWHNTDPKVRVQAMKDAIADLKNIQQEDTVLMNKMLQPSHA